MNEINYYCKVFFQDGTTHSYDLVEDYSREMWKVYDQCLVLCQRNFEFERTCIPLIDVKTFKIEKHSTYKC